MTKDGGFSLVTDVSGGRVKKLPSFYVNSAQTYAHRDVAVVQAKLLRAVEAFTSARRRSTYMVTACEIAGRKGLYATDFFNRSDYRRKLTRLGMRFSDDPFAELHEDGTFSSADFDPFRPAFLTLPRLSPPPPGVVRTSGARLAFQVTFYRIADIGPEELGLVVKLADEVDALSAADPADLAAALTGGDAAG